MDINKLQRDFDSLTLKGFGTEERTILRAILVGAKMLTEEIADLRARYAALLTAAQACTAPGTIAEVLKRLDALAIAVEAATADDRAEAR